MTQSTRRAPARELIEAAHSFPGEYTIKAFGPATDAFRNDIAAAVYSVLGERFSASERMGSKRTSMCITLSLQAQVVDEVLQSYDRLLDVANLKMIL